MNKKVIAENPEDELFRSKNLDRSVNAGVIAVEQERAIAEAQGAMVIAKKFPRDEIAARKKILDSCKRLAMAEIASFSYKRGGSNVEGPTIRLAEELARNWGNIEYGIRELAQKPGATEMEAFAWDKETNTVSKQTFTVRHLRDKQGGATKLTSQRDIYEIAANMGARRLRSRIMSVLPPDLIEAAVLQCRETIKSGGADIPMADRVLIMIGRFETIGIQSDTLAKHLGHSLENILPDEFADLHNIFTSIKGGFTEAKEWFGADASKADKQLAALTDESGADPVMDKAPAGGDQF